MTGLWSAGWGSTVPAASRATSSPSRKGLPPDPATAASSPSVTSRRSVRRQSSATTSGSRGGSSRTDPVRATASATRSSAGRRAPGRVVATSTSERVSTRRTSSASESMLSSSAQWRSSISRHTGPGTSSRRELVVDGQPGGVRDGRAEMGRLQLVGARAAGLRGDRRADGLAPGLEHPADETEGLGGEQLVNRRPATPSIALLWRPPRRGRAATSCRCPASPTNSTAVPRDPPTAVSIAAVSCATSASRPRSARLLIRGSRVSPWRRLHRPRFGKILRKLPS